MFRSAAQHRVSMGIPQFMLFEVLSVLARLHNQSEEQVASIIGDLIALIGADVIHELTVDIWLQLWPMKVAGPVDGLSVANGWRVAMFDQSFARRLKRIGAKVWQPE